MLCMVKIRCLPHLGCIRLQCWFSLVQFIKWAFVEAEHGSFGNG